MVERVKLPKGTTAPQSRPSGPVVVLQETGQAVGTADPRRLGGGSTPAPKTQRPNIASQAKQKVSEIKKDITQNVNDLRKTITKQFRERIRGVKNRNEKLKLEKQLNKNLQDISISKEDVIGKLDNTSPEEIIKPKTIEDIRKEFVSKIEKVPGASKIKEIETKRQRNIRKTLEKSQRGEELTFIEKQSIAPFIREDKKEPGGFSLTQKGFELIGFEFGDREEIINEKLRGLTEANTLKDQNKAIQDLRKEGINVQVKGEQIEVDTSKIASAPASQFIVDLTDSALKFALFSPFLSTAAAAKGKGKATAKGKSVRKIPKKKAEDLLRSFEDDFKKKGQIGVQDNLNTLIKNIEKSKTGDKALANSNVKQLFKELEKRGLTKELVLVEKDGVIGIVKPGQSIPQAKIQATKSTRPTFDINIETFRVPKLVKTPEILTTTKAGNLKTSALNSTIQKLNSLKKQLEQNKQRQNQNLSPLQKSLLQSKEQQLLKQIQKQQESLKQKQGLATAQAQKTLQRQTFKQKLQQQIKKGQIARSKISGKKLKLIVPGTILGLKKKRKLPGAFKQQGYFAFARQKGKKIKISKVPVTKRTALNQSAFFVDKTLSARGSIKKANKLAQKPKIEVPKGYFKRTKNKYRTFRISKGARVPLKNAFIEKRKFRLDTKNEKQTIQQLRKKLLAKTKAKQIKSISKSINKKPFKPDGSMLSKRRRK